MEGVGGNDSGLPDLAAAERKPELNSPGLLDFVFRRNPGAGSAHHVVHLTEAFPFKNAGRCTRAIATTANSNDRNRSIDFRKHSIQVSQLQVDSTRNVTGRVL